MRVETIIIVTLLGIGVTFTVVAALVTNFHLPKSSLLMMICAFSLGIPINFIVSFNILTLVNGTSCKVGLMLIFNS